MALGNRALAIVSSSCPPVAGTVRAQRPPGYTHRPGDVLHRSPVKRPVFVVD
jgi:hypothetical protein